MLIADNFYLLFFYPLGGKLVDTYGLSMMSAGSVLISVALWWWYFSFQNFASVLLSRIVLSLGGAIVATTLLRISNNWYAQDQRALAVAIGTIAATLGAGAALVIGPFFSTGEGEVNFQLKSCEDEFIESNVSAEGDRCEDEAREKFCCAAPTEIDL